MTDNGMQLTRRKILAGMGGVGAAGAAAGLGTSALFSDEESFENNSITAGELDLKVDWEEHYSYPQLYGFDDPTKNVDAQRGSDPGDGYVGLPDPDHPVVWVKERDLDDYMSNTAIEAFPDPDNDGELEVEEGTFTYEPCNDGADIPQDLGTLHTGSGNDGAVRTKNDGTTDDSGNHEPLISLEDVKPGDFGEFTFSFHLCDNPGYVWLQAANFSEDGGANPEPEVEAEGDADNDANLAENIRTVWWYDDGDNVLTRKNCDKGQTIYLSDHGGSNPNAVLYEVTLSGSNANTTKLVEISEFDASHIGAAPDGETIYVVSEFTDELAVVDVNNPSSYSVKNIALNGFGPLGDLVQAAVTPGGALYVASKSNNKIFEISNPGTSPTVTNSTVVQDASIGGADNVFTSNGQFYLYASGSLYTVDLLSGATNKLADVGRDLTGLAVRSGGQGDFLGSISQGSEIISFDASGNQTDSFTLTGDLTNHTYGDLTTGSVCERVIGEGNSGVDILQDKPLNEVVGKLQSGIQLTTRTGDSCFQPGFTRYIGFAWWVPEDVGNEIQGDSVSFDLGFYTEQCRNNATPDGP